MRFKYPVLLMLSIVALLGFAGCSSSNDSGTVKSDKTPPGAQAAAPGTMPASGGAASGPTGAKAAKVPTSSQ